MRMLPTTPTLPTQNDAATGLRAGSAAAKLLADGRLGARLVQSARLAAALHMAQSAALRKRDAQFVPEDRR
jgi:hypothetical protein